MDAQSLRRRGAFLRGLPEEAPRETTGNCHTRLPMVPSPDCTGADDVQCASRYQPAPRQPGRRTRRTCNPWEASLVRLATPRPVAGAELSNMPIREGAPTEQTEAISQ